MDTDDDGRLFNRRPYIDQSLIPYPLVVRRGHTARINFLISGHPPPKVTWSLGNVKVASFPSDGYGWTLQRDADGRFCLIIDPVMEELDQGITLGAANMLGETSCYIPVTTYKVFHRLKKTNSLSIGSHSGLVSPKSQTKSLPDYTSSDCIRVYQTWESTTEKRNQVRSVDDFLDMDEDSGEGNFRIEPHNQIELSSHNKINSRPNKINNADTNSMKNNNRTSKDRVKKPIDSVLLNRNIFSMETDVDADVPCSRDTLYNRITDVKPLNNYISTFHGDVCLTGNQTVKQQTAPSVVGLLETDLDAVEDSLTLAPAVDAGLIDQSFNEHVAWDFHGVKLSSYCEHVIKKMGRFQSEENCFVHENKIGDAGQLDVNLDAPCVVKKTMVENEFGFLEDNENKNQEKSDIGKQPVNDFVDDLTGSINLPISDEKFSLCNNAFSVVGAGVALHSSKLAQNSAVSDKFLNTKKKKVPTATLR